jgi:hypothetical protein
VLLRFSNRIELSRRFLLVVRFLPATRAISRVPVDAAVRNEDTVNGACGKNMAAASMSVIISSSPHWEGSGRTLARASLSVLRLGIRDLDSGGIHDDASLRSLVRHIFGTGQVPNLGSGVLRKYKNGILLFG